MRRILSRIALFTLLACVASGCVGNTSKARRVLIVGGGSSHDFNKWFNEADVATINSSGKAIARYTDKTDTIAEAVKDADVLYLSNNQPIPKSGQDAITAFADSGKGIILIHAATWFNWKDWPAFNARFVTGGSRGHDRLGEFEVVVTEPSHPVMKGVPAKFKITDELYNFQPEATAPAGIRKVLATATSPSTGKTFPIVWIAHGHKSRIVVNTLGHDGRAHQHPAYIAILNNSIAWVSSGK